jgi:dTDP-4-amino-4,6-dideoxygalactose transaminase
MKTIPLIDLVPAHRALERGVLAALRSVYRRNAFVLGDEVRRREAAFSCLCGALRAVGVASGTAALTLSLRAMGAGEGDEVVTTPFTFFATASSIVAAGATPRFADVDAGTLNLDPAALERACTRRTRAVLPVHLFGQPAAMDEIGRVARRRRLDVLEDACQAHGARFAGRPVGSWGRAACFSFYPSKNVGALGDGGMVVTDDARLAEELRMLRNCGRRDKPYEHVAMGYVERLDNLQAAVLEVKLKRLDAWNRERRRLAAVYDEELAGTPAVPLAVHPRAEPVYHLYTVRAPRRDALKARLASAGIGSGVFYQTPLHLQPAFKRLGYGRGDFPEAERAAREVLSLPLYPGLPRAAVARAAREVRRFYRG